MNLLGIALDERGQSLVALAVAADEAAQRKGLGGLGVLALLVDLGHVDLHGAKVVGRQDAVGPRAGRKGGKKGKESGGSARLPRGEGEKCF